jgi:site-specific recombinase XerD
MAQAETEKLTQILWGAALSRALCTIAELGIADQIVAGSPQSVESLSRATGTHERSLYRILRFLASHEIFQEKGNRQFDHTPLSHCLRGDAEGSFRPAAQMMHRIYPGPSTRKKFFEFFTVPIRNAHTRAAYYRAIQQFLAWSERAGYQDLEDIEPITVAAYIEMLQRRAAPPTVKQHMAAIRMLFSWLTEKGVLAMNPAREVKTERFSRTEGKTPAVVEGEVQKLLGAIETSTHTGLRDRALLGVLAYTFARIGAVVNLKVEDYYPSGKRFLFRFKEKGGKEKELPVHHKLEELLDQYLKATGLEREPASPLFPAAWGDREIIAPAAGSD